MATYDIFEMKNLIIDKSYIISSRNGMKTLETYKYYLKTGEHFNKTLQADWKKYGEGCFDIELLEQGVSQTKVDKIRDRYIQQLSGKTYNVYKQTGNRRGDVREILAIHFDTFTKHDTYVNIEDAGKATGLPHSSIRYSLRDGRICNGYIFVYVDSYKEWFMNDLPEKSVTAVYNKFGYLTKIVNFSTDIVKDKWYYKNERVKLKDIKFLTQCDDRVIVKLDKDKNITGLYSSSKDVVENTYINTRQRLEQLTSGGKQDKYGDYFYRLGNFVGKYGYEELNKYLNGSDFDE
jgi:hypothetical protein